MTGAKRLLNQIAKSTKKKFLPTAGGSPDKPVFSRIPDAIEVRDKLAMCPLRFALDLDVAEFARELVLNQPDLLCSSLDILRVPDEMMWVEWAVEPSFEQPACQIGILVEADAAGRSGVMTVVYSGDEAEPNVSPVRFFFDFDAGHRKTPAGLAFSMNHESLQLEELLDHVHGEINPVWAGHWRHEGGQASFARQKLQLARDLWMAPCLLFGFSLILTTKAQLQHIEIDYSRLNLRREKRAKPPLFAHTELRVRLFENSGGSEGSSDGESGLRKGVRLHHVRGHFVRRGNAVFWRKPHLRGDKGPPQPTFRTRRVQLA